MFYVLFLRVNNKISSCNDIAEILLKLVLDTNQSIYLPLHVNPSPLYPGLQSHLNEPIVLIQTACESHLDEPFTHSSISVII